MSTIPVQKAVEENALPAPWIDDVQAFSERVRNRAFELFEKYGRPAGQQLEHWFEAERQLFSVPRAELVAIAGGFEIRIALPGFDASEIEVTALPDTLLVKAQASNKRMEKAGDVRFSEFSDQSLFRRIRFPEPIDTAQVTAKLEKGVLDIVAYKAVIDTAKKVSIASA